MCIIVFDEQMDQKEHIHIKDYSFYLQFVNKQKSPQFLVLLLYFAGIYY